MANKSDAIRICHNMSTLLANVLSLCINKDALKKTMLDIVTQNLYLDIWDSNAAYNFRDQKVYHMWMT